MDGLWAGMRPPAGPMRGWMVAGGRAWTGLRFAWTRDRPGGTALQPRTSLGMRTLALLAVAASLLHAADDPPAAVVPEAMRIRLDELSWPVERVTVTRDGSSERKLSEQVWMRGDGSDRYPTLLGRIEAGEIVWNHAFYPVTRVTVLREDDPPAVRLEFSLGTLELRAHRQRGAQSECVFTPADGSEARRFRTGGNWGAGTLMSDEAIPHTTP
jgi:hypothetical protein